MNETTQKNTIKKKKLEKGRELEIIGEMNEPKKVNQRLPERQMPEITFEAWWMRTQKKYNFSSEMKEVVYKHFRARGFLRIKKFDEGLRDFGIKS